MLDSMFFPHNDEQILTLDEIKDKKVPNYIYSPTIIFFNPNA